MEGKYTKIATITGLIVLGITLWQLFSKSDKKLDGEWQMTTTVQEADLKDYKGLQIKWKMFITENSEDIKGTAEKTAINNIPLDYKIHTSMTFEGHIKGNKMILNYTETGKLRNTSGIMEIELQKNRFNGTFSQTASNTSGTVTGIRTTKE